MRADYHYKELDYVANKNQQRDWLKNQVQSYINSGGIIQRYDLSCDELMKHWRAKYKYRPVSKWNYVSRGA